MNRYQKIYIEGVKEKLAELKLELDSIPEDYKLGDNGHLLYDDILIKMKLLELAFTRYILEVVADRDKQ